MKEFNIGDLVVRNEPVKGGVGDFVVEITKKKLHVLGEDLIGHHYEGVIKISDSNSWPVGEDFYLGLASHFDLYSEKEGVLPDMPNETELHTDSRKILVSRHAGVRGGVWLDVEKKPGVTGINTLLDVETALELAHDLRRYAMESRRAMEKFENE